ncbi:hypothetical protein [Parasediminibacterium sp. JCM 36343]|uniref:hypothetical protein n=1 Tax=Parasediminibacterium sp. JCM 36343 TaxID=3374279 RepID=UPI003979FE10
MPTPEVQIYNLLLNIVRSAGTKAKKRTKSRVSSVKPAISQIRMLAAASFRFCPSASGLAVTNGRSKPK